MGAKKKYLEKRRSLEHERERLRKLDTKMGYLRLLSFAGMVAGFILLLQAIGGWALLVLALMVAGFGKLVRYHERIKREEERMGRVDRICALELKALGFDFSWNTTGKQFFEPKHPYLADLDVFGTYSLYQYLNRGATLMGQKTLAFWLAEKASAKDICDRQEAVADLQNRLEFRQNLAAEGLLVKDNPSDLEALMLWLDSDDYLSPHKTVWLAKWILPVFTLGAMASVFYLISWHYVWIPLLLPLYLIYRTHKKITEINIQTEKCGAILKTYSLLLRQIESQKFNSSLLIQLQKQLFHENQAPSKLIAQLGYRIDQLNVRQNFFGLFFNLFAMWDFHWVVALEKSKRLLAPHLQQWFEAIGIMESLASFANLRFNNPDYCFPKTAEVTIRAKKMGHPLIDRQDRVTNDISLALERQVRLITGSNMAGKSTYLRTVGINLVLANAGAPVCAESFEFDPRPIYTSMRVADDLEDGASSFYAELSRLKSVIDAVENQHKIIFLLDEILKGTNSADRNKGSEALLKQLLENNGTGLVATHDLALTKMEAQYPDQLENWYFDVLIKDDKLAFDYVIKQGVCQSFNATLLMKKMGIKI